MNNLIIVIAIAIGIVLLLREFVGWYFKINIMVQQLESQTKLIKDMNDSLNNVNESLSRIADTLDQMYFEDEDEGKPLLEDQIYTE